MIGILKVRRQRAYITRSGKYTHRLEAACEFQDLSSAVQFCRRRRFRDVELIVRTDEPEYDLSIPLNSGWSG